MGTTSQQRLNDLLDLACMHREWSRVRLARELGRDRTRLCPASGDPKLSYLSKLARILEWPVQHLIDYLDAEVSTRAESTPLSHNTDFTTEYELAYTHHIRGNYRDAVRHARAAQYCEASPTDLVRAINVEAVACESRGLYEQAHACWRNALARDGVAEELRMTVRGSLSVVIQAKGDLDSGDALAESCLSWFPDNISGPKTKIALAFAHYAHACAHRRLAARFPEGMRHHMEIAAGEYALGRSQMGALAEDLGHTHLAGVANSCRSGLFETQAALGIISGESACEQMLDELDALLARPHELRGDWLESLGWWTVSGGNVALRHLSGRRLQETLERFSQHAIAIARTMDNWAFRERALSMGHALRTRINHATGYRMAASIQASDVHWITGTMGRFPHFQQTGWEILQDARLVRGPDAAQT